MYKVGIRSDETICVAFRVTLRDHMLALLILALKFMLLPKNLKILSL